MDGNTNEIWKDVPGFEGMYKVSNLGRIKSLPHKINIPNEYCENVAFSKEKILKQQETFDGYMQIKLQRKTFKVHRIVLAAFSGKTLNYPFQVNHIDENTKNNNVNNLEWCTPSYNVNYGNRNRKVAEKTGMKVKAISSTGETFYFRSQAEAGRVLNLRKNHISEVINGKRKKVGRYTFVKSN